VTGGCDGGDSGVRVVDKSRLGTSVGFSNVNAKLSGVVSDTVVDRIVLSVAVEDGLGIDSVRRNDIFSNLALSFQPVTCPPG
jgi:hypothetical protein